MADHHHSHKRRSASAFPLRTSPPRLPSSMCSSWIYASIGTSIPRTSSSLRYNYFRNEYPFNTNNGGLNALDAASDFHDRAHIGGFQLLTTFSPTALNELRASEPYRNEHHVPDPVDGPGPVITVTGIATFNGTPLSAAGTPFCGKNSERQRQLHEDRRPPYFKNRLRVAAE